MSAKRFTLDTNILVYAVDRNAKDKHEKAILIVDEAIHLDCVLTLQSLGEFYMAATRKKDADHKGVVAFIKELITLFPIITSSSSSLFLALKAVEEHNLSFWDALLWATAKENHCSYIISEDFQHDFTLQGITIKNPFNSKESLENLLN